MSVGELKKHKIRELAVKCNQLKEQVVELTSKLNENEKNKEYVNDLTSSLKRLWALVCFYFIYFIFKYNNY